MLPYVIVHNAVSVDGRMDKFQPDVGLYNFLALIWKPDVMLTSSNTILSWFENEKSNTEKVKSNDSAPGNNNKPQMKQLLAVVDSRGRVKEWNKLRNSHHWRDIIVLCSESTPKDYIEFLKAIKMKYLISGKEKVNFNEAFIKLKNEFEAKVIRVDSGGTLNGVLFSEGLVNEVSIVMYPYLVGGESPSSIFYSKDLVSSKEPISLKLIETRKIRGNLIWSRYSLNRD